MPMTWDARRLLLLRSRRLWTNVEDDGVDPQDGPSRVESITLKADTRQQQLPAPTTSVYNSAASTHTERIENFP